MIKDILLVVSHTDADDVAIETAVKVAEVEDAHLAIVIPVEYPVAISTGLGVNPYPVYVGIYEESLKAAESLASDIRKKMGKYEYSTNRSSSSQYFIDERNPVVGTPCPPCRFSGNWGEQFA